MSFRIDDILKDKKCSFKTDIVNGNKGEGENHFSKNDQSIFNQNSLLERDRDKAECSKLTASYVDYLTHCLPCITSQSPDLTQNNFTTGFVPYKPIGSFYSRAIPHQANDKIYANSYIYPEKIYSPTTYNHVLPINFPIYNHYSKRRNQVRFSTSQTKALEHKFSWQKYLSPEDRKLLAFSLKLSDRQVKTWFQNRRAKWRRNISGSSNSDMKMDISNPVR